MGARSGKEYLEGLRDERQIFIGGDRDGTEDTGLDGVRNESPDIDNYGADYVADENPFPQINGTELTTGKIPKI